MPKFRYRVQQVVREARRHRPASHTIMIVFVDSANYAAYPISLDIQVLAEPNATIESLVATGLAEFRNVHPQRESELRSIRNLMGPAMLEARGLAAVAAVAVVLNA